MKSRGVTGGDIEAAPNHTHLTARHIAFLDMDRLYFEIERFKAERGWYNLNLTPDGLAGLLADQSWYQLLFPAEELACDSFEKIRLWEDIALSLLKKYTERRSEEHTSELQSLMRISYAVFCLQKKKHSH